MFVCLVQRHFHGKSEKKQKKIEFVIKIRRQKQKWNKSFLHAISVHFNVCDTNPGQQLKSTIFSLFFLLSHVPVCHKQVHTQWAQQERNFLYGVWSIEKQRAATKWKTKTVQESKVKHKKKWCKARYLFSLIQYIEALCRMFASFEFHLFHMYNAWIQLNKKALMVNTCNIFTANKKCMQIW